MKDKIGDRMKSQYENRTRYFLPRRTYTIIRIDGKAFHTYTRGLDRPFDVMFVDAMDQTANALCKEIQCAKFAYTQSDEISILLTDFDKIQTNAWFDGNIQKMASISASIATAYFNDTRRINGFDRLAMFDARVFTIPDRTEVENYFIWRQQDCVRNSISSVAQSLYSPKELHGKSTSDMQEMIFENGQNWNDYPAELKRGRMSVKEYFQKDGATRSRWVTVPAIWITKEREEFSKLIPDYDSGVLNIA